VVKILVTGSAGFIAGYLVEELLTAGHEVVGLDDFSKYGPVRHAYDDHPRYRAVAGDAKDVGLVAGLLADCDHFVAGAAIIGGISLFHERAYDLLAENERITAAAFDAAIGAHRAGRLRKITVVSSSMVYEAPTSTRPRKGSRGGAPRPGRPTASRSWPPSTSRRGPASSTPCRTRSSGRSTASAWGRGGRGTTRRSSRATSGWR
jgi:nucleoside-diphosphate-sugar epimerase